MYAPSDTSEEPSPKRRRSREKENDNPVDCVDVLQKVLAGWAVRKLADKVADAAASAMLAVLQHHDRKKESNRETGECYS